MSASHAFLLDSTTLAVLFDVFTAVCAGFDCLKPALSKAYASDAEQHNVTLLFTAKHLFLSTVSFCACSPSISLRDNLLFGGLALALRQGAAGDLGLWGSARKLAQMLRPHVLRREGALLTVVDFGGGWQLRLQSQQTALFDHASLATAQEVEVLTPEQCEKVEYSAEFDCALVLKCFDYLLVYWWLRPMSDRATESVFLKLCFEKLAFARWPRTAYEEVSVALEVCSFGGVQNALKMYETVMYQPNFLPPQSADEAHHFWSFELRLCSAFAAFTMIMKLASKSRKAAPITLYVTDELVIFDCEIKASKQVFRVSLPYSKS